MKFLENQLTQLHSIVCQIAEMKSCSFKFLTYFEIISYKFANTLKSICISFKTSNCLSRYLLNKKYNVMERSEVMYSLIELLALGIPVKLIVISKLD